MSWVSDAWDWASDLFSGSSSGSGGSDGGLGDTWVGRNWDTIQKGIDAGRKVYNAWDMNNSRQDTRDDLLGIYKEQAAQDAAYQQQLAAYRQQQAAGARRTAKARREAQAKAFKAYQKSMKDMMSAYQPYADAAKMLTPKMADNYSNYLDTTKLLSQYLSPMVMKNFGEQMQPSYMPIGSKPGAQPEAVSFPTLDEVLGKLNGKQ